MSVFSDIESGSRWLAENGETIDARYTTCGPRECPQVHWANEEKYHALAGVRCYAREIGADCALAAHVGSAVSNASWAFARAADEGGNAAAQEAAWREALVRELGDHPDERVRAAVARELTGFIWAIACEVTPAP